MYDELQSKHASWDRNSKWTKNSNVNKYLFHVHILCSVWEVN